MKFTKRLVDHGKTNYFFSNDGRYPVNEDCCSAEKLSAELDARNIKNIKIGLYALGGGQYGVYAESI